MYKCECGRELPSKRGLANHRNNCKFYKEVVLPKVKSERELEWNKVRICKWCGKEYSRALTYPTKCNDDCCNNGCIQKYQKSLRSDEENLARSIKRSNSIKSSWNRKSSEEKKAIFDKRSANLSDETRKKFSDNSRKQMEDPARRYMIRDITNAMTPEQRSDKSRKREANMSEEKKLARKVKIASQRTPEKESQRSSKRDATMKATNGYIKSAQKAAETRRNWSPERRTEVSGNQSEASKRGWKNKTPEQAKAHLLKSLYSKNFHYSEKFWENVLIAHNVPYKRQHFIYKDRYDTTQSGYYVLDFLIGGILNFEVDGSYHSKGDQPTYDAIRDQFMRDAGFHVHRVKWIAQDVSAREQQVQELLRLITSLGIKTEQDIPPTTE